MRTLVIHAHPSPSSFSAALVREVCVALGERGHCVDACDLYAEKFDPVLPLETFRKYLDAPANQAGIESYVDRLLAVESLVFVFPVWHDGPPAILKGYFDRVFLRGVVFDIDENGVFYPKLHNVRRLAAVVIYGAVRERTRRVGDLPRRFFQHNLVPLVASDAKLDYLAAYGMDGADSEKRESFLKKIRRAFHRW